MSDRSAALGGCHDWHHTTRVYVSGSWGKADVIVLLPRHPKHAVRGVVAQMEGSLVGSAGGYVGECEGVRRAIWEASKLQVLQEAISLKQESSSLKGILCNGQDRFE